MTEKELKGLSCHYCKIPTEMVTSASIYGKSYGNMCMQCPKCKAYVGCSAVTDKSKGSVANEELRAARILAHNAFDPLWREEPKKTRGDKRTAMYKWLAEQMGVHVSKCHMGMFDLEQCEYVYRIATYKTNTKR